MYVFLMVQGVIPLETALSLWNRAFSTGNSATYPLWNGINPPDKA